MMTTAVFFVVLATALAGVDGTCKEEFVEKIKKLDTFPKKNITSELEGEIVWLTAPSWFKGPPDTLSCYETFIDGDETFEDVYGTDFLFYGNLTNVDINSYQIAENEPGVLTLSDLDAENKIYVISLKSDVLAYYQCDSIASTFEGFGGLGVVNTNLSAPDFSTAHEPFLKEATAVLTDLG